MQVIKTYKTERFTMALDIGLGWNQRNHRVASTFLTVRFATALLAAD